MNNQPQHPYEAEGYEVLCTVLDQMEADLLLEELNSDGIESLQYPGSQETALNFPPTETSGGIRILVKKEQLDEARQLYERFRKQPDSRE